MTEPKGFTMFEAPALPDRLEEMVADGINIMDNGDGTWNVQLFHSWQGRKYYPEILLQWAVWEQEEKGWPRDNVWPFED